MTLSLPSIDILSICMQVDLLLTIAAAPSLFFLFFFFRSYTQGAFVTGKVKEGKRDFSRSQSYKKIFGASHMVAAMGVNWTLGKL